MLAANSLTTDLQQYKAYKLRTFKNSDYIQYHVNQNLHRRLQEKRIKDDASYPYHLINNWEKKMQLL
jgi:hypothetical protein